MLSNEMTIKFKKNIENVAFARSVVACFMLGLNPSVAEVSDVKTAVSEAVTNASVHGYKDADGDITIKVKIEGKTIHISVIDEGEGIEDIKKAREPFFTTKESDEHTGMGITIMETFMDSCKISSIIGKGTTVDMTKRICG